MKEKTRNKLTLIALCLIFLVPLGAAMYTYNSDKLFNRTTNRGILIQPPINMLSLPLSNPKGEAIKQPALRGHWLYIYVSPRACGKTCQQNLYNIRQIRTAIGKDQGRVRRAILTFTGTVKDNTLNNLLKNDYKGTAHFEISRSRFANLIEHLPSAKLALTTGYLYLVDPQGNLMMGYAPGAKPADILKDLEKLLKISQVG